MYFGRWMEQQTKLSCPEHKEIKKRVKSCNAKCTTWTKVLGHQYIIPKEAAQLWKSIPRSSRCTVSVLLLMPEEVWRSKAAVGNLYALCASTLGDPALWLWNIWEGKNFTNCLVAVVGSYYNTTLNLSEPCRMTHSLTNVCKGSLWV